MFRKSKIAIDIGSHSLKAAIGYSTKKDIRVQNILDMPVDESIDLQSPESFKMATNALRQGLDRAAIKYKGKDVVCTAATSIAMTRHIILPKFEETKNNKVKEISAKELDGVVKYEVENYLSMPLETQELRYCIDDVYDDIDGVKKMKIFVATVPKSIVKLTYDGLKNIGLNPVGFELHATSVHKLCALGKNEHEDKYNTYAVIDIGHGKIEFNVIHDGYIDLSRSMYFGGRDIDKILMEMFGLERSDAEYKKLLNIDLRDSKPRENMIAEEVVIQDTGRDIVMNWLDRIQKIIRYYTSKDIGHPIEHIYLHGGSSSIKGLEQLVEASLQIGTTKLEGFENIVFHKYISDINITKYANVIGALIV